MRRYASGEDLEDAIFGRHSDGEGLIKSWEQEPDFDRDVKCLIETSESEFPPTRIGGSLHSKLERELDEAGLDSRGLLFLTAIGTVVDLRHYADGVFFLPSIPRFPVTVDAFNVDEKTLKPLKNFWVDSSDDPIFSEVDYQSALFRYKTGMARWKRNNDKALKEGGMELIRPVDFRECATDCGRPENHFILNVESARTYEGRRAFARMLARYFVKVAKISGQEDCEILALLSP